MSPANTSSTNRRVAELVTDLRDGSLVPDPKFQRRLVWSSKHRAEFIKTVLMGLPFPEVFISQGEVDTNTGDATEWLVDGQQRLTTLAAYFSGDLDVPYEKYELQRYEELSQDQKTTFLQYLVAVRDLGAIDHEAVVDIFERINSTGYSLNAMEVNNARYDGPLKQFAESIPGWDEFESNRVFTARDAKRMNDVRYCLSLIITMMSGYFHRENEHEEYLRLYNDEFPERDDLEPRLRKAVALLDEQDYDSRGRAWRKADLFTLLVEIDRLLQQGRNPGFASLSAFIDDVDNVAALTKQGDGAFEADARTLQYMNASIQGVNDRGNRTIRGEIINQILSGST